MGVDGSAYYESFKHLNAKIIKPAVAEVNKSSDIIIEPQTRKKGRAVSDIRFLIKENPQMAMFQIDDSDGLRNLSVYKALRGQGVSDRLARQWITEHGQDYVQEKLDYVAGQGEVKSSVGYLRAAIMGDYSAAEGSKASPRKPVDPETQAKLDAQRSIQEAEKAAEDAAFKARAAERRERAKHLDIVETLVSRRNRPQSRRARVRVPVTSRKRFGSRAFSPAQLAFGLECSRNHFVLAGTGARCLCRRGRVGTKKAGDPSWCHLRSRGE